MVAVSWWLNRRYFPTPYAWGRIGEYVVTALAVFFLCEEVGRWLGTDHAWVGYAFNTAAFAAYTAYFGPPRAHRCAGVSASHNEKIETNAFC